MGANLTRQRADDHRFRARYSDHAPDGLAKRIWRKTGSDDDRLVRLEPQSNLRDDMDRAERLVAPDHRSAGSCFVGLLGVDVPTGSDS